MGLITLPINEKVEIKKKVFNYYKVFIAHFLLIILLI